MIPNRQHMEQMTVGMTSYFLSISRVQTSTSAPSAPAAAVLSPVGSSILDQCWRHNWWMFSSLQLQRWRRHIESNSSSSLFEKTTTAKHSVCCNKHVITGRGKGRIEHEGSFCCHWQICRLKQVMEGHRGNKQVLTS